MEPTFEKLLVLLAEAGVQFVIVYYASKAALLRLKGASAREKDRLDVIALRRLAAGFEG